jgi:hypothetical protein
VTTGTPSYTPKTVCSWDCCHMYLWGVQTCSLLLLLIRCFMPYPMPLYFRHCSVCGGVAMAPVRHFGRRTLQGCGARLGHIVRGADQHRHPHRLGRTFTSARSDQRPYTGRGRTKCDPGVGTTDVAHQIAPSPTHKIPKTTVTRPKNTNPQAFHGPLRVHCLRSWRRHWASPLAVWHVTDGGWRIPDGAPDGAESADEFLLPCGGMPGFCAAGSH